MKLIVVDEYYRVRSESDYRHLWQRGVKWGAVEHGLSIFAASVLAIRPICEPIVRRWSVFSGSVSRRCSTRRGSSILPRRKITGNNRLWGWASRRDRPSSNMAKTTAPENLEPLDWGQWSNSPPFLGAKALHGRSLSYVCPISPGATPQASGSFQEGATDYFSFSCMANEEISSIPQRLRESATTTNLMEVFPAEPGPQAPARSWFDDRRFSHLETDDMV